MTDIHKKDIAHALHPYTNLAAHEEQGPLVITRGEGVYVWDDQNNRYLEGLAGLWCVSLGFSEERLAKAAADQFAALPYSHTFAHRSTEPVIALSEKLIEIAPEPMTRAFFLNSGSEAIDAMIRFTWYYNNGRGLPKKKKIISRKRGYHGVTVAGGSLTAIPLMQNDFDLPLERMIHTDPAGYYRYGQPSESEEAFASRLADNLEQLIINEGPDTIAAFVAEPVMGAGGVMLPPATYFGKIQAVLDKYDVLMVADEVICGFGRTGNMWGSQTYDIRPDMVTCAKQLSSGYLPISALMISDKVYEVLKAQSRKHGALGMGYTYGGHPVSCAVALETLKIYEERDTVGHVRSVAPRFQERLAQLGSSPLVGEARGVGLIGALELVMDKNSKEQFPAEVKAGATLAARAQARGLIVRALPGDVIGICPPLIITEAQIDELFDSLAEAVSETEGLLRRAA
ncbi:MAG: aminotransferase class III-fold pyridoxal phosphate-dependent enzyme [Acidiferrobacteraceae bacterium]|nr:aminotransferase class III-fold pyridoxal phosphate-dependent enzyme [Acidiferrobacteraceae bacterium]MBT3639921.1 aminotransferase class III-fold pyridoxal phosphate-dependent enzyme [Acidiferrobacteraceae bacterium]MBT3769713.1 aminotransferase class III-fold pyridoxal phosphate-dependent enzyme [Acidiferrobacteraceae bacterium]MBT3972415.1 aminotransferase class III-fold pyridoxal phosphate-dependent enzyme [Acidiferrobacteraceae bacterium]MBT4395766.1 aminotransferase class III-fold pyri